MKLTEDKILLEGKRDIAVLQTMIVNYLYMQEEKEMLDDTPVKELEKLSFALDMLSHEW